MIQELIELMVCRCARCSLWVTHNHYEPFLERCEPSINHQQLSISHLKLENPTGCKLCTEVTRKAELKKSQTDPVEFREAPPERSGLITAALPQWVL